MFSVKWTQTLYIAHTLRYSYNNSSPHTPYLPRRHCPLHSDNSKSDQEHLFSILLHLQIVTTLHLKDVVPCQSQGQMQEDNVLPLTQLFFWEGYQKASSTTKMWWLTCLMVQIPLTFAAMRRPSISFAVMGIQLTTCFRKHKSILSASVGENWLCCVTWLLALAWIWQLGWDSCWSLVKSGNLFRKQDLWASSWRNPSETIFHYPSSCPLSTTRNKYGNPPDWKQSPSEKKDSTFFQPFFFLLSSHKTFTCGTCVTSLSGMTPFLKHLLNHKFNCTQ